MKSVTSGKVKLQGAAVLVALTYRRAAGRRQWWVDDLDHAADDAVLVITDGVIRRSPLQ